MRVLYDYDPTTGAPAVIAVTSVEIEPDNSSNGYCLAVYQIHWDRPLYFKVPLDKCPVFIKKIAETGYLDLTGIPRSDRV